MCEVPDYDYAVISSRTVTTRTPHECTSCMRDWPAGSTMLMQVGKIEGELPRGYLCAVCRFAGQQPDHTALHFCYGHFWPDQDHEPGDAEVFAYLAAELATGREPVDDEALRRRDQARAAQEQELNA